MRGYYNTHNGLGVIFAKSTVKRRTDGFVARKAALNAAKTAQVTQQAATLPPATTPTQESKPAKTWKDYMLWIALGGALAFGAYKMLTGKKKRR